MNSYSEVRRVRAVMSEAVGHDVRRLIAKINERRLQSVQRIIDPGREAEQCDAPERSQACSANDESRRAAR